MIRRPVRSSFLVLRLGFGILVLLAACSSAAPTAAPTTLRVEYTFAAQPWLADLYDCARPNLVAAELRAADYINVQKSDMAIRIGEPSGLTASAYQIGTEEVLVIVHPQNPVTHLDAGQVRALFSGQVASWQGINGINATVQVWVFPTGEDIQQIFEQNVLGGLAVVSTARLAATPDEMSRAVADDVNAVGILPRHWKAGNVSDVFVAASVPVLALLPPEAPEVLEEIAACLQE